MKSGRRGCRVGFCAGAIALAGCVSLFEEPTPQARTDATVVLDSDTEREGGVERCPLATSSDDTCDGVDDDCDGLTDEGYQPVLACGDGICAATATPSRCVAGNEASCIPGAPQQEACNGFDDDCDGRSDEEIVTEETCRLGRHACPRVGRLECSAGGELRCAPADFRVGDTCDGSGPGDFVGTVVAANARGPDRTQRAIDARFAWNDAQLALTWTEVPAVRPGEDRSQWYGSLAWFDVDGCRVDGDGGLIDDPSLGAHPLWIDEQLWVAWTSPSPDGIHAIRAVRATAAAGLDPFEALLPGVSDRYLRSFVLGPRGALLGWHRRGAPSPHQHEIYVAPLAALDREQRLTSNARLDRGPLLVPAPDRIGALWASEGDEGIRLWFRILDQTGRPISAPVEIGSEAPLLADGHARFGQQWHATWAGSGFRVTWVERHASERRLATRLVEPDGELRAAVPLTRPGEILSLNFPSRWVPALQSTAVAWTEALAGEARIFVGLLDPISGELTRSKPIPPGEGEQLDAYDLVWLGDRLALVWEERVSGVEPGAEDEWLLVVGVGNVGCGRERCRAGPTGGLDDGCDGIDEDCDEMVDEDYVPAAECGVGVCAAHAAPAPRCVDGVHMPCRPGLPELMACSDQNETDDDCDGSVEEGRIRDIARSDFDAGAEGWRVRVTSVESLGIFWGTLDPPNHVEGEGGDPGGHVSMRDPNPGYYFFSAPGSYVGGGDLYGGSLSFSLRTTHDDPDVDPLGQSVVLFAADGSYVRYPLHEHPRVNEWSRYTIPLVEGGWLFADGDTVADRATVRGILGALEGILIPADWGRGLVEDTALDSVVLRTSACD